MTTAATLQRRLVLGGELLSVVATMKGLAAVSIHEFEEAVEALRHYRETVELGFQALFSIHPHLIPANSFPFNSFPANTVPANTVPSKGGPSKPEPATVVVVIGTDQGMCGPINHVIAQEVADWLREHSVEAAERRVVGLGARVVRELAAAGVDVDEELQLVSTVGAVGQLVEELILHIDRWRRDNGLGRVMVFHQRPLQRTRRIPRSHQVTPPDVRRLQSIAARPWPTRARPATPHDGNDLLAELLRQDLLIGLFQAVVEAKAAEHGARLAAMQAAEQNIEEQLERLRNQYHRLRQARITSELLDVLSGFEALRDP